MTAQRRTIHGWGRHPRQEALVLEPASRSAFKESLGAVDAPGAAPGLIARGMGRSYGDSALAPVVLQSARLDHLLAFDAVTGVLRAEAGVTLREVMRLALPAGWRLPVMPGTGSVTVGGAIAADVHGKNHSRAGSFGRHVLGMTLLLGDGRIEGVCPGRSPELFHATCGGMGLTGVVLDATLQLERTASAYIDERTAKASSLGGLLEQFEAHADREHRAAWLDCMASGRRFGRGVLVAGDTAEGGGHAAVVDAPRELPCRPPAALLNDFTVRAFNALRNAAARHGRRRTLPMMRFLCPLDAVGGWNGLYGAAGLLQHQSVLPKAQAAAGLEAMLRRIAGSATRPFLAVLKEFGPADGGPLSFPMEGYTLALDFRMSTEAVRLLHALDELVCSAGGRIYLAKDAVMGEPTFKAGYPRWREFEELRRRHGAVGRFASAQSRRLGLA
jgi:decaprenylphospho-beta-D-ribofuranose 2-oxidase